MEGEMDWLYEPVKQWQVLLLSGFVLFGLWRFEKRMDAIGSLVLRIKDRVGLSAHVDDD